jgi:CRP-like cAMP-binding protein
MTEEEQLRTESVEIERLLEEIRELIPLPVWQRVERVVRRVVALYAAGIARTIEHAWHARVDETFPERLAADELVASLLLLHELHPLTVEQRVDRALAQLHQELGLAEGGLVLETLTPSSIELRATVPLGGGAMAERVAEGIIRRVLESAAPELTDVKIARTTVVPGPGLVQIRVRREGA